jgi:plastocyanin
MNRGGRLLALVSAVLLLGAEPHSFVVTIENVQFSPATLRVHRGDTIVWVNKDLFPHTVTADGKAFDSHDIAPDASWSYRVTKPGDFNYTCIYHPTMKGQLSVQ